MPNFNLITTLFGLIVLLIWYFSVVAVFCSTWFFIPIIHFYIFVPRLVPNQRYLNHNWSTSFYPIEFDSTWSRELTLINFNPPKTEVSTISSATARPAVKKIIASLRIGSLLWSVIIAKDQLRTQAQKVLWNILCPATTAAKNRWKACRRNNLERKHSKVAIFIEVILDRTSLNSPSELVLLILASS